MFAMVSWLTRAGNQQLMIGTHRWPLLTSLELAAYKEWLMQRRKLLPADAFCWTWIQTHLPDWFMTTAYERPTGKFDEPIGPQPEQIRLLTYIALGCGYRGLGVLVGSLPGRQPHGPRSPAGPGPAQPGIARCSNRCSSPSTASRSGFRPGIPCRQDWISRTPTSWPRSCAAIRP